MSNLVIDSRIERDIKILEKNLSFLNVFLEGNAHNIINRSEFSEIFGGIASAVYLSASMRILSLCDNNQKHEDDANLYSFLSSDINKKQRLDDLLSKHKSLLATEKVRRNKMNAHTTTSSVDSIPSYEFLELGFDILDFAIDALCISLNESDSRRESYDIQHKKLLELIPPS